LALLIINYFFKLGTLEFAVQALQLVKEN